MQFQQIDTSTATSYNTLVLSLGLALVVSLAMAGQVSARELIAFVSDQDGSLTGNREIYIMTPDGNNVRQLTDFRRLRPEDYAHTTPPNQPMWSSDHRLLERHVASDSYPAWAPDGRKVAFVSSDGASPPDIVVYSINVRTHRTRMLMRTSGDVGRLSWSRDGKFILFDQVNPTGRGCYILDVTRQRRKAIGPLHCQDPALSPDGRKLVFLTPSAERWLQVCTMDADGSNVKLLTNINNHVGPPAWSPDGRYIAYEVGSWGFTGNKYGEYNEGLWVMDSNGSHARQLTQITGAPSWSPDGKRLTFSEIRVWPAETDIYVINADGTNLAKLPLGKRQGLLPVWSPAIAP